MTIHHVTDDFIESVRLNPDRAAAIELIRQARESRRPVPNADKEHGRLALQTWALGAQRPLLFLLLFLLPLFRRGIEPAG